MELRRFALVALLASASAFQLRPCAGRTAAARPALAQPPRILLAEEGNELPSLPSPFAVSDSLIQFSTLSDDYKKVVLAALEQSNKGRILSGMPVYPSVEGMVESYMEYEGTEKGMSLLEAEDEVVRYLQRKALLDEGGLDGDAQEYFTFGLLALLIGGVAYALIFPSEVPPV
uniref:Uncharacterized protein n=1 Tax=Phaeocystis antarctica TaxID=33657 RepID=A0A7S0HYC8_9EUKA